MLRVARAPVDTPGRVDYRAGGAWPLRAKPRSNGEPPVSLPTRVRAAALRRLLAVLASVAAVAGILSANAPGAGATTPTVALDPTQVSLAGSGYFGDSVFQTGDVAVSTTATGGDAAYATGMFAAGTPLASAGNPVLTLGSGGTGAMPDMRLLVDFDGDGIPDGTLVGDPAELPDWSLTPDSLPFVKNAAPHTGDGVSNPQWYGTLSEWSGQFPGATIVRAGYSLGPDETGSWPITGMTVGGVRYTFSSTVPGTRQL